MIGKVRSKKEPKKIKEEEVKKPKEVKKRVVKKSKEIEKKIEKKPKDVKPKKTKSKKTKSKKISKKDKKIVIEKIKSFHNKLMDIKRNNDPHFGNNTLVQTMKRENFNTDNIEGNIPRKSGVVLFYANWCPHCHSIVPLMNDLAERVHTEPSMDDMMVGAIDCATPENDNLSDDMNIQGFPTIKIYKNGKLMGDYNGPRELPFLLTLLKKMT